VEPLRGPRSTPALLAALALATGGGACGEGAPDGAGPGGGGPPPSVTVTEAVRTQLPDERERVGQIRAVDDVELRARITGFLEEQRFDEGSDVEAGTLLFVIERAPYQAEVKAAEAELARAEAALQEAQLGLRRTRTLHQRNVQSEAALDAAVAKEAQARAEVLAAQAHLTRAQLDLSYTEIRAPVSGRVGESRFDPGDLVEPDSGPLTTVVKLNPIYAYWQVPEQVLLDFRRRNRERLRNGEEPIEVKARLRFADGSIYEHEGVWDFLDNRVASSTGTQTARAVFPNPDGILLPGQYARVIVEVGEPRETLVIPQSAVQEDQAGRFVLVVDDEDKAVLRRVEMGARQGIYWEVASGIAEGERVIYQGVQKVRPGQPVAPVSVRPERPTAPRPAT
jgi:membrane fusion protein (multidrug efflux system)